MHATRHHATAPRALLLAAALLANPWCAAQDTEGHGLASPSTSREQLHAVLWMQQADEYRALMAQTWRLATEKLIAAEQPGTAVLEQRDLPAAKLASMPTAVIVDLDETVLDNSFYQARLVRQGREYDDDSWFEWMLEARAPATPGAREFLIEVARRGHRVFYVTNRQCEPQRALPDDPCPAKTATRRNLVDLGLPGAEDPSSILMRGERPEWSSGDKSVRRAHVGTQWRVIMNVGDDLRDLVDRPVFEGRREELQALLGTRWFILPNAMYGSWERALVASVCTAGMSREECSQRVVERKYAALETSPPPLRLAEFETPEWNPAARRLRLATWNIEYLLEPDTYAALAPGCVQDGGRILGAERAVPCAIVPRLDRVPEDFAALRKYAAELDADVVALQEVDGPGAARQILPGYEFCFTKRPNVQKNGFAIRRGLPFRCEPEYLPLSLHDTQRRGVVVTLFPGAADEIRLLNVHLRSGCPEGPLTNAGIWQCGVLAAQVEPLEQWIDEQARAGRRFAVLGDFNRRFSRERGPARDAQGRLQNVWPEVDDRDPPGADLTDVTAQAPFRKCISNDPFDAYIDTIWLSRDLARRQIRGSVLRVTYSDDDASRFRLSDHCPVGVDLALGQGR